MGGEEGIIKLIVSGLTFLQLQLDPAPAVVDKVNNLQILRREREILLGGLQAGRPEIQRYQHCPPVGQCLPGIFYISHLDWSEHNPAAVKYI